MCATLSRPVVVGVDGTDQGLQAVRYAVQEARRLACGVRLVHAMPEMVPMAPALPLVSVETLEQVGHRIVNEAKQLAYDTAGDEIEVEKLVRSGSRVHVLVRAGEDARVIVLGRRDRSLLGRIFTTSTCVGVAARAGCPVVCVPAALAPGNEHGQVVVGVEGPVHAEDSLAVAFAAAAQRKARLRVVHAWKLPGPYDDIIVTRVALEEWRRAMNAMLGKVLTEWRVAYPDVEVEVDVRHQPTAPALVAASEDADLLVLGRRGHAAPPGLHLGSTARTLIREARCPVEIAPHNSSAEPR